MTKQISGCLGVRRWRGKQGGIRGRRTLASDGYVYYLIVLVVSWENTCGKPHQTVQLK